MKGIIKRIWTWFVKLLDKVSRPNIYHFVFGLIIAAFVNIVFCVGFCIWPVFFVAFGKEFIDQYAGGEFSWSDVVVTMLGGMVIQIFAII